ncbi:adenylyl-sulfate kinase [Aliidiomarina celeris]|uniref:adenylyl-sulfate kinase n=1 Tax=Aliidiomarina celeris TaxID=2249428 RepID=UPI000DE9BE97|nr:adenylyl-sulfate kinase [Aliidiomarina celeris]
MDIAIQVGKCFWITGLSAAGKTTTSTLLANKIRNSGEKVVLLDGDKMRAVLEANAYTKAERLALGYTYSRMCKMLVDQGIVVIIAVIGLFHELHVWNRNNINNYIEVFLDVPIKELERRDPKGIYKRARLGELKNVAGVDLEAEFPLNPDFHFKWTVGDSAEEFSKVLFAHFINNT